MDRRGFLKSAALAAAGTTLAGCNSDLLNIFNTGKEQLWGMNVHSFDGALGSAQIEALRQLGVRRVRLTLGLHSDAAAPYLRGYDAEYVGLVADYLDPIPSPSAWPGLVRRAVERAPGLFCYEILNEPVSLTATAYVEQYLKPAYQIIKGINPGYKVAAAAPTGTSGGRVDFYAMTSAGADSWCDYRAAHVYTDNPEYYLAGTDRPFLITESGVQDPARHVDWWVRTMTHISGVLETDRVYFYTLSDSTDSGWALISRHSRPGAIRVLSPLYDYIKSKYGRG
ncbi:MAG: hypothetical protein ACYC9Y_00340 [Candidatus Methylomirabilia bacterium]